MADTTPPGSSPASTPFSYLSPPFSSLLREPELHITLPNGVHLTIRVPANDLPALSRHRDDFLASLLHPLQRPGDAAVPLPQQPQPQAALTLLFLRHLLDAQAPTSAVSSLVAAFERDFLSTTDVHNLALQSFPGIDAAQRALSAYYDALGRCSMAPRAVRSALLDNDEDNDDTRAKTGLIFGGQGTGNLTCLQELRTLCATYGPLLSKLVDIAAERLSQLCEMPHARAFYAGRRLDLKAWLRLDDGAETTAPTAPDPSFLACAAVSVPLVGLLSLAHYAVLCKALAKTPSELLGRFRESGLTGHSQGLLAAAAIAQSDGGWDAFYATSRELLTLLFHIGFECHHAAPPSTLSAAEVADCVDNGGEGRPSAMLAAQGLSRGEIAAAVAECNGHVQQPGAALHLALANGPASFVVAGPPRSLRGLCLHLRGLRAGVDEDQSRVPHGRRKKAVALTFLPISAPFHSPHLAAAAARVKKRIRDGDAGVRWKASALRAPVYHTATGADIRAECGADDDNLAELLVDAVACDGVDWPAATRFPDATCLVVLGGGGGRLGEQVKRAKEGRGVSVAMGSELRSSAATATRGQQQLAKADLFATHLPASTADAGRPWAERFAPRLVRTDEGELVLDTRFSRALGCPPVMVAGMTPTTAHWDFAAAVANAGYHVELAGGGFFSAAAMTDAVEKLVHAIPPGRGVTCNLIYSNPEAMGWQVALLTRLRRERLLPIEGVVIGAGVPSPDVAAEYIGSMGLSYIGLKPGSTDAIRQVLAIADAHPTFPVVLQWTGGRGGGHHSYEDFHAPILSLYAEIRRRDNITLVAGSGFGDAAGAYPYITGEWAQRSGCPPMPFDGVLLGSRMMVAKEAHTSPQSKRLISEAAGVDDETDWEKTYDGPAGGVITVQSEMRQPIHKLATRGVRLWAEMDKAVFSLPKAQRAAALASKKEYIIARLNADFAKPWFGMDDAGNTLDLEDMTYAQVLSRVISLMYVHHQSRWIDPSYVRFAEDIARRTLERLSSGSDVALPSLKEDPTSFNATFTATCPASAVTRLHPEDVRWFVQRCKARGQKPVNFIPVLNEDFEYFFKKDSLWQSEDVDAVIDRDAGRVCILQSPVSVRYSHSTEESAKDILDGVHSNLVAKVLQDRYRGDASKVPTIDVPEATTTSRRPLERVSTRYERHTKTFQLSSPQAIPEDEWIQFMIQETTGWMQALFSETHVMQDRRRIENPFRRLLQLRPNESIHIDFDKGNLAVQDIKQDCVVCNISSDDRRKVRVDLSVPSHEQEALVRLPLHYEYRPFGGVCRLFEETEPRVTSVKNFYRKLWLDSPHPPDAQDMRIPLLGKEITITQEMVQGLGHILQNALSDQTFTISEPGVVPLDTCMRLAWEELVRPLMHRDLQGDITQLVHRSNRFQNHPAAAALRVGDTVKTRAILQAVKIEDAGKLVTVQAVIERSGEPVVTVTSDFLFKGMFSDFGTTFSRVEEPQMLLDVPSQLDEAVLRDQPWLQLGQSSQTLEGNTLLFPLFTEKSWKDKNQIAEMKTTGEVYLQSSGGNRESIGSVSFEANGCAQNPVMEFLRRKGRPAEETVSLKTSGWAGEASKVIRMPESNEPYANVSRDNNPIHLSAAFAAFVGLPGTLAHGMASSAVARAVLQHLAADGAGERFASYQASFVGMVHPGDVLRVSFSHHAMKQGRMVLKFQARKEEDDGLVLEGEAEVDQPSTVYIFTGQGSQAQNMGMELYASSPVARRVWDEVDQHLKDLYGWSILEIVRQNPKELTVRFRGKEGRRIRENYLAMSIETTSADGTISEKPILEGLTRQSASYTFSEPRGLLYSTQFAQPAITLLEKAAFEDMRAKGLVQEGAAFAGHSLGEYGALAALAEFMQFKELARVVFYRGLTMQVGMKRDKAGRSDYSMMAVNPSRVGKWFDETMLRRIVGRIAHASGELLEIVNLNVVGEQYVCAGRLHNLDCLTGVLNRINKIGEVGAEKLLRSSADGLDGLVKQQLELRTPAELARGVATLPLKGIDVPFHSSYLAGGVQPYRRFLQEHIAEAAVDPGRLEGRFVPNVMAKVFAVDAGYVKEACRLTGSSRLEGLGAAMMQRK